MVNMLWHNSAEELTEDPSAQPRLTERRFKNRNKVRMTRNSQKKWSDKVKSIKNTEFEKQKRGLLSEEHQRTRILVKLSQSIGYLQNEEKLIT